MKKGTVYMSINKYNVKKWCNMLKGNSSLHVKQGVGKVYSKEGIRGYYNDLTLKVESEKYIKNNIPFFCNEKNELEEFSAMIFQYGLGAYDLYIQNKDKEQNYERFKATLEWAMKNQLENGAWITFKDKSNDNIYSSMAQGEGASLLLRGYTEFNNSDYLKKAKLAIDYLMKPIEEKGTALYKQNEIFLKEYMDEPVILNGWIFSLWGIYDYLKIDKNNERMKEFYQKTLITMENHLQDFDNGYWSKYDSEVKITSPFYHNLHINQLKVMYDITGHQIFQVYASKFEKYEQSFFNRIRAFIKKAMQKIMEK